MLSRRTILSLVAALAAQVAVAQEPTAPSPAAPPPTPPPAAEPPAAQPPPAAEPPAAAAPAAPAEVTAPAATAPAKGKEQTEEIVVTGTRIRRKDLTTPAPVTVINREAITSSGKVSIGDFLQALPEQGNAINTGVNNGGDGATRVSLRALGAARTLVLVNGRRMVAGGTGADASVDLSTIPTAAIERVEVLKDGASALYGSDAIGGVINLITRKNWSGTEANAFGGVSGHNDTGTYDVSVTTGSSSDTSSFLFSAGYFSQNKSMAGDRSFSKVQYGFDQAGGQYTIGSSRTPGGRISTADAATGSPAFQALVANNPGSYLIHDSSLTAANNAGVNACIGAGGTLAECQWRHMDTSNTAGFGPGGSGDNYNFAPFNYLVTPQQRISLWANGDTKFADVARGYFEASFVNRQSRQQLAPEPLIIGPGGVEGPGGGLVTISADNLYNPFGKDFERVSRRLDEFGFRTHKEDNNTFRTVLGFDGTLPEVAGPLKGWFWDASYNFGRTQSTFTLGGSLQSSRIAAALGPSMLDAAGNPICVSQAGNAASVIQGCVPLDLFHGTGTISQAAVDYLGYTGTSQGTNNLSAFQLNTSGELFSLPASERPVGLALGYEYRYQSGTFINEPLTAKSDTSNGGAANTGGSFNVSEGYAELSIPILSAAPFADDLEATAAARVFDYSTFGTDWTYKVGARYRPIRDVTVRGTYSTAFRAPSIPDLYAGAFDNFPSVSDPCASVSPTLPDGVTPNPVFARCGAAANNGDDSTQLRAKNGGNSGLQPEKAKIFTVGLVFEPTFFRNLTATLDYYHMRITDSIQPLPESIILNGCYVTGTLGPSYCDGIARDPTSQQITRIANLTRNAGTETVAGIDLALRYAIPTPDFGRFGLTFDGTWLQKHDLLQPDGSLIKGKNTYDLQTASSGQGAANPEWKFNAGVVWGLKNFGAGVSTKFLSGFHECGDSTGDYSGSGLCYIDSTFQRHVSAYNTYDLFLSYNLASFAGKTNAMVGVNNVFDSGPPSIYNTFASRTDQYTYDQIGRFFYVRLNQAF